jgi:hypothetical protein
MTRSNRRCAVCGRTGHDDDFFVCGVCGRTVCRDCTYGDVERDVDLMCTQCELGRLKWEGVDQ